MAGKPNPDRTVTLQEILMTNTFTVDALVQLLIDKGLISEDEFFTKLKQVQAEYQRQRAGNA